MSNADSYIDNFLLYYGFHLMEDGLHMLSGYLDGFFIRKVFSSILGTIKTAASSIKSLSMYAWAWKDKKRRLCHSVLGDT